MEVRTLDYYLEAFGKMNRAMVRGVKAPHKPLLLLSVLHLVRLGEIVDNHILLSNSLISEFKRLWVQYIGNQDSSGSVIVAEGLAMDIPLRYPFKCSIENPYFHLQHEPFWRLVRDEAVAPRKSYSSIKSLRSCFQYAEMDKELFEMMRRQEEGQRIEDSLIELLG